MLQLSVKRKINKPGKPEKHKSLIVECPSCKAVITIKNAQANSTRFCWRCLKEVSIPVPS